MGFSGASESSPTVPKGVLLRNPGLGWLFRVQVSWFKGLLTWAYDVGIKAYQGFGGEGLGVCRDVMLKFGALG